ncbi:HNH endonuclease [Sphingobacterium multivorum]|uniref:HNH endonuclease n=1 Tax=Sphingobacterium multivorum TaxID=28454 RepID=UPI0031BB192D
MYTDHIEDINDYIVIIDPYIHRKARINRSEFLSRVSDVKAIRTAVNSNYISFYITSVEEFTNIKGFYDLINKAKFSFTYYYSLAVAVKPPLFNWFKNTNFKTIEQQIIFWLASLYYFVPKKRDIMEQQIYPMLFQEIQNLVEKYYKDFPLPLFCRQPESFMDYDYDQFESEWQACHDKYLEACNSFYSDSPPDFLESPFDYKQLDSWGINDRFGIEFLEGYFSDNDWNKIILNGYKDTLRRCESRSDLWEKWKHTYGTFDQRKNPIFSFYYDGNDKKEESSNTKRKRSPISKTLKFEIYQRDKFTCRYCGRTPKDGAKLSLDHKIPYSDGGKDTYENLITACMDCNIGKSNKVINIEDIP